MNDIEIIFDYDRMAKSLTLRVGRHTYLTAAGSEIETLVDRLGDWLIEEGANCTNLSAKPYDEDYIRDARIVNIKIPRQDEISRE